MNPETNDTPETAPETETDDTIEISDVSSETPYTVTIFDAPPAQSGSCSLPDFDDVEVGSLDDARDLLDAALTDCADCGEYEPGDKLYMHVWDDTGEIVLTTSEAINVPFSLTLKQCAEIEAVDFGEIEEYYAEDEIDSRRKAWNHARDAWDAAIVELLGAEDRESAIAAIKTASRIESEWGDDPSTQRVAEIAGLDTKG